MKTRVLAIGLAVGMAATAAAQSESHPQKLTPWARYNDGVHWEKSLDEALKKAEKTGRPLLLHQLVGDMRAEGC